MLLEAVRTDIKKDYNEVCYHHLGAEGFFVGRDSELNQIVDYFSNNGRVLVLYGLDGMGKSALARHYAWRATLSYDIVWWINASTKQSVLESYSTFLDQLPAISKTLGKKKKIEDFQDSGLPLVERFHKALSLATASWLLIYDNLSYDTKSERAWLQKILPAEGNGRILVTTHTHREYDGAGRIKVDPLDENSAVNLLSCKLREWDKGNVQALAKRLHCFPLALTLAGGIISTTPGYTAQKCMNDLERHGLVCLDDGLEETEYHQSILAIIRTLYDKIKEERQYDQCSCVVEPLLLCCALGAPYDINIWNFHKMLHFQHSTWTNGKAKYADSSSGNDENVKLEDLPC